MLKGQDGNPSTTRSVFWYGCLICILKLFLSKIHLGNFQVPEFNGGDFGMAIVALGGIYSLDKHISNNNSKDG